LEKKIENQRVYEEEMTRLAAVSKAKQAEAGPQKITKAQIDAQREQEVLHSLFI
jgi:hypothetical protein